MAHVGTARVIYAPASMTLRIATWNVNSLKARIARVEEWLAYAQPDILCMQEIKCSDDQVPAMAFKALGYEVVSHGEGRWNGVAIASRLPITDFVAGFSPADEPEPVEARFCSATCGDVRVTSVYVPNGRTVGSEHYEYKLRWLGQVRSWLETLHSPGERLVLCGDFNIAPDDRDVWDAAAVHGGTHVSPDERAAFRSLLDWGLVDSFREVYDAPKLFSWWDYRAGDFHQGRGMRIDHVLATKPLADQVAFALIDRNARKGKLPSDHAPLLVDIAV
jgi:exodeoxyribonuclease-3